MKTYLRYASGVRRFLEYARGYKPIKSTADFAEIEARTLAAMDTWDFRRAAGITLASVSADPRNHFGKYSLRRFDND